jgi:hypothetical protein
MIILKPLETAQVLKFIGRQNVGTHLILRDEQDNTEIQIDSDYVVDGQYLKTTTIFDLQENRFYNLTVYNSTEIIYRDKLFCTSQTNYSINNGAYTQNESNNDYITL